MPAKPRSARRWVVRGLVQGVGFRHFTYNGATALGLTGYARNLDDGTVEVYAVGPADKLDDLAAHLRLGPRYSDVRGVEEREAPVQQYGSFDID